ncbi:MAG TPA: hypothetical protein VLA39_02750 [Marinobacterium sp.]|nr:hypothetical protein [Marinobacterium sp.]
MFGMDPYVLETLIPSLVGVIVIASVMTWGFIKVKHLMEQEPNRK